MPLYDFICECGFTKEEFLKLKDKEPVCDMCGKQMKKLMSTPAFHLKGNGWEKDGYCKINDKKFKSGADKKNGA